MSCLRIGLTPARPPRDPREIVRPLKTVQLRDGPGRFLDFVFRLSLLAVTWVQLRKVELESQCWWPFCLPIEEVGRGEEHADRPNRGIASIERFRGTGLPGLGA